MMHNYFSFWWTFEKKRCYVSRLSFFPQNETITKLDEEMNKVAEERSQRKKPMRDWRRELSEKLCNVSMRSIKDTEGLVLAHSHSQALSKSAICCVVLPIFVGVNAINVLVSTYK